MCHTKGEVCLVNGILTDTHTHMADTATRVSVRIREKEVACLLLFLHHASK